MASACIMSVVNAVVTNLSAASVLKNNAVGKDYSVLETTQDTSAVVGWGGLASVPVAFGNVRDRAWLIRIEMFVKDTGAPSAMMDKTAVDMERIIDSIESDPQLQDTVEYIGDIRGAKTPGEAIVVNDKAYIPINIELDVALFGS